MLVCVIFKSVSAISHFPFALCVPKSPSTRTCCLQGSSQRLDRMSESDTLSQSGDYTGHSASPISTPNIAKRKSVNDR